MPKVIIDTSGASEGQFTSYDGPVPPKGLYKALFKRGWWVKSSTGKPMLKVLFILETELESKKQYNGCPSFHNVTNEASTAWKMKELFTALGTGAKSAVDMDEKGNVTRIGSARPGKTYLLIHSKIEMYQGSPRFAIDTLAPLPNTVVTEDIDAEDMATSYEDSMGMVPEPGTDDSWGDSGFSDDSWSSNDEMGGEPPF
jgi:hypothetical protein